MSLPAYPLHLDGGARLLAGFDSYEPDAQEIHQLLADGVLISDRSSSGATLLHMAAQHSWPQPTVDALLGYGPDLEARTTKGDTPLTEAAKWGHATMVKALLDAGADLEANGDQDAPALWQVTRQWVGGMEQHMACAKLLVDAGANLDAADFQGRTVLDKAREKGGEMLHYLESAHTERYLEKAFAQPHTPDGQALGERLFGPADTSAQPVRTRRAGLRL